MTELTQLEEDDLEFAIRLKKNDIGRLPHLMRWLDPSFHEQARLDLNASIEELDELRSRGLRT